MCHEQKVKTNLTSIKDLDENKRSRQYTFRPHYCSTVLHKLFVLFSRCKYSSIHTIQLTPISCYPDPLTGMADNYTCTCAFGYEGINCERAVDFCKLKNVDCHHGTCDLTFKDPVLASFLSLSQFGPCSRKAYVYIRCMYEMYLFRFITPS